MQDASIVDVSRAARLDEDADVILAADILQDCADYRGILQSWFGKVRIGGFLILTVPHAFLFDRRLSLPSARQPAAKRLYTPGSLVQEVEEALLPNSYRIRHVSDDDEGYDYALTPEMAPSGRHDVRMVIERIAEPQWVPGSEHIEFASGPGIAFEEERTRIEGSTPEPSVRILLLKLDHLGDFIMGVQAIERVRTAFPDADITLVVGSWNVSMATRLGIADSVIAFDAFPRNSSEEHVEVRGKAGLLEQALTGDYDLAIDLRTDPDTRPLLRSVRARVRAGIGDRVEFPFLDIFLPIDGSRHEPESARSDVVDHSTFSAQPASIRSAFRIAWHRDEVRRAKGALIWGPYRTLSAGQYVFEPFIELEENRGGCLISDLTLDGKPVAKAVVPSPEAIQFHFDVPKPSAIFEFRLWRAKGQTPPDFSFYGGRLFRRGAGNVLHQSEYLALLVELVIARFNRSGLLREQCLG